MLLVKHLVHYRKEIMDGRHSRRQLQRCQATLVWKSPGGADNNTRCTLRENKAARLSPCPLS